MNDISAIFGADGSPRLTYIIDGSQSHWQIVVRNADEGDLKELLISLILEEPTREAEALLDDFVCRHQCDNRRFKSPWTEKKRRAFFKVLLQRGLRRKRGRQHTPIYARSEIDARIDCAIAEVRAAKKCFVVGDKEIDQIAAAHKVAASTLQNALQNKRGSAALKAKRRKHFLG